MNAVILLSGGMDSTTLLYWASAKGFQLEALSFDYGQRHKKELEFSKYHTAELRIPHKIIRLDFSIFKSSLLGNEEIPEGHYEDKSMKSTVVPFRNGIMLAYAVGYAESIGANRVLLASHAGDHAIYPDCRPSFTAAMNAAAQAGTYNSVRVESPFNRKTKKEIVIIGRGVGVNYNYTWSCYKGLDKQCGKCGTCVERLEALNG